MIRTIWTGVDFVAAAALDGAGGGPLPGAASTGISIILTEESRGSGTVASSLSCSIPLFALLEVVLKQQAHAVRAFAAVAEGIETVAVARDHPPHLVAGGVGQGRTHARLPAAGLRESRKIVEARARGPQARLPAVIRCQRLDCANPAR